ncbi:MAG: hypothetical protein U1D31_00425 [Patescibacteria group bacterium]|nr:hypothetical protein [bacterium]MDZ4240586.1 hypothetical protein [Patescibacteria group bacterium]
MKKDEIIFEKPEFGKGAVRIAEIEQDMKRRKIRWKADVSRHKPGKCFFLAYWRRESAKLELEMGEERGYLYLRIFFPDGKTETYNASTDPSLNSLFARVEYIYLKKMKKFPNKQETAKV